MSLLDPKICSDFYKVGHVAQLPPTQIYTSANFTARSNRLAPVVDESGRRPDKIAIVGVSAFARWFLCDLWNDKFFSRPLDEAIVEYEQLMSTTIGPVNSDHIRALWELQYLPIVVKALPEGSMVGMQVPFLTIRNTHPEFAWLAEYLETAISTELWKVITSATLAFEFKRMMLKYYKLTGAPIAFLLFAAHDFSLRGLNGLDDGYRNGLGHLANFCGTDTIPAIKYARTYYDGDIPAGSIPASEHSVTSSNILYIEHCLTQLDNFGGKSRAEWEAEYCAPDGVRELAEYIALKRHITEVYPKGLVGWVSDTFDYWRVVTRIVPALKDVILAREPDHTGMAKLVIRPDSGDPVEIVCGTDAMDGTVKRLYDTFGGTQTDTGHIMLNERIGVIYGDSINFARGEEILSKLMSQGFAASNIVFGLGSYFYNGNITRDTFGMAMKATYAEYSDIGGIELFKDPATDPGKKSARGLLRVDLDDEGNYVLRESQTAEEEEGGELAVVFEDGVVVRQDFSKIRARLETYLD